MKLARRFADHAVVLGSALVVALFAGFLHAPAPAAADSGTSGDLLERDPCEGWAQKPGACRELETAGDRWSRDQAAARSDASRSDAARILDQVRFPKPGLAMLEVDDLGNLLLPVQADALVTHDGGGSAPFVAGPSTSRCARSVAYAQKTTDGPFTVVCLPVEYGLYERMNGRPAPTPGSRANDGEPVGN